MASSPTFWAKALTEKPLRTAASEVESMSGGVELEGGADDQRNGDHTGVHAQHVLQAVQEHLRGRQHLVDWVSVSRLRADRAGVHLHAGIP
jgi:hypothetical protein